MEINLRLLGDITIICGFCFALGKALDLYLLKRQKSKLHIWLEKKWFWLDEQKIPDLFSIVARRTINVFQWVFGKKLFSWRVITLSVIISIFLTSLALFLGSYLDNNSDFEIRSVLISLLSGRRSMILLYGVNYVFDLLTLLITFRLLLYIAEKRNFSRILLIGLDSFLALILAIFVVPLYLVFDSSGLKMSISNRIVRWFEYMYAGFTPVYIMGNFTYTSVCYSATSFIPTFIYLSFLFLLFLSKYVLVFFKWISSGFLLRAIEEDPEKLQVFTLTGTLFGLFGAFLKVIFHFMSQ